jgi:hypothetical protein
MLVRQKLTTRAGEARLAPAFELEADGTMWRAPLNEAFTHQTNLAGASPATLTAEDVRVMLLKAQLEQSTIGLAITQITSAIDAYRTALNQGQPPTLGPKVRASRAYVDFLGLANVTVGTWYFPQEGITGEELLYRTGAYYSIMDAHMYMEQVAFGVKMSIPDLFTIIGSGAKHPLWRPLAKLSQEYIITSGNNNSNPGQMAPNTGIAARMRYSVMTTECAEARARASVLNYLR